MLTLVAGNAAFQSLKSLTEIIGKIRSAANIEEVRQHASSMTERVLAAQQDAASLIQENVALVQRNQALESVEKSRVEFDEKAQGYEKRKFDPGVFVYVRKDFTGPMDEIEPFCPRCFEHKQLSTLHATGEERYRYQICFCPECKNQFVFGA